MVGKLSSKLQQRQTRHPLLPMPRQELAGDQTLLQFKVAREQRL